MSHSFNSFTKFPHLSKKTVLLIIVVAAITLALSTAISLFLSRINNLHIPSLGTIHTVGVEAYGGNITVDENGQHVDWGKVYPGTLTNLSFYLRSKSNIEIILNLTAANWTFLDSQGQNVTGPTKSYMNLTWNYNDTPIGPREEIYATLTLNVSDNISFINYIIDNKVEEFMFDIHIHPKE